MSTDAYRKCSKCGSTPAKDGAVSYHRFPKPGKTNVERARAWARFCWPNEDWQSIEALKKLYTSNKVLCKRHFDDHCFTDSSKKNLGKFAIPTQSDEIETEPQPIPSTSAETPMEPQPIPSTSAETPMEPQPGPSFSHQAAVNYNSERNTPRQATVQIQTHIIHEEINKTIQQSIPQPKATQDGFINELEVHQSGTLVVKKKKKGILASIGVKKLQELTPREGKLYKICKRNLKEINRIKNQLKKKKKENQVEYLLENENINKLLDLNLSNSFVILLQSQLRNCKRQKKGRRYTIDQKIMALTLYKKSPACYRLLRRLFTLPCQSTVKKLLNKIPLLTGINAHIFKSLKEFAEKQLDEENLAVLLFDEMAIRKHLHYNVKHDLIEGFQDHGNHDRSPQIACNALVFMLSGLRKKWKQPVAFYFSGKSVTAGRLSVIIKEILHECFKTGLKVVATVCDLSTVNIKALELLGSTKEKPYFNIAGHEIVSVLDPPHLLKCTRNLFMSHDIEINTDFHVEGNVSRGVARWSHLENFYELDQKKDEGDLAICTEKRRNFVFAPALTDHHLRPNSKQKMRVKLAAQIFSHSVAAGILTNIAMNKLPAEAHATATICSKFDELFDALNADTPDLRGGKPFSTNITNKSPHLNLFNEMRKFISVMKFEGSNSPPPSQSGWIRTMNAVESLWSNLKKIGVKTLSTRRLNQDPLENCFGCIRYHCGSNDNPNIGQFIAGIKTAIINNLRHSGTNKNCEDDDLFIGNNLKSFLLGEDANPDVCNFDSVTIDSNSEIELESLEMEAYDAIEQASPEAQACAYVCGFVYKKIKHSSCDACNEIFLIENISLTDKIHIFTSFKEYDIHNNLKYVRILEENAHQKGLKNITMNALSQVDFSFLRACSLHYEENVKHIKQSTFFICIKRFTVLKNRAFSEDERNKSLKKKINILQHK